MSKIILGRESRIVDSIMLKCKRPYDRTRPEKVLLVEGATDREFFTPFLKDGVRCISAAECDKADEMFSGMPTRREGEAPDEVSLSKTTENYKQAIKESITELKFKACCVYGIVDNDTDDFLAGPLVWTTDTRDLETMLLKTDESLRYNFIDGYTVPQEVVSKSLFLAQQTTYYIDNLRKNHVPVTALEAENLVITWQTFVGSNCKIDGRALIESLAPDEDALFNKIIKSEKGSGKRLDKNGKWRDELADFKTSEIFWSEVNGHLIAQAYAYFDERVGELYSSGQRTRLNRTVERSWIRAYDRQNFYKTELSRSMQIAGLIKSKEELSATIRI